MENPKEYICREVDIVVDHVGNVSASLDGLISQTNAFSDAELRESNASNKHKQRMR